MLILIFLYYVLRYGKVSPMLFVLLTCPSSLRTFIKPNIVEWFCWVPLKTQLKYLYHVHCEPLPLILKSVPTFFFFLRIFWNSLLILRKLLLWLRSGIVLYFILVLLVLSFLFSYSISLLKYIILIVRWVCWIFYVVDYSTWKMTNLSPQNITIIFAGLTVFTIFAIPS